MQIAEVMKKMVAYSEGNTHDINHLLKVWAYAKTIDELEKLDEKTQKVLKDCGLSEDENERIVYLVGHHHTLGDIQGLDYQILIEADYLVNADESHYSPENIRNTCERLFRTKSGTEILKSIYMI